MGNVALDLSPFSLLTSLRRKRKLLVRESAYAAHKTNKEHYLASIPLSQCCTLTLRDAP